MKLLFIFLQFSYSALIMYCVYGNHSTYLFLFKIIFYIFFIVQMFYVKAQEFKEQKKNVC